MKGNIALTMSVLMIIGFTTAVWSAQTEDLTKLFPDLAGWQKKGAAEIFFPENLYQYIDGAAENFLNYGFVQLAVQNYTNAQDQSLSAEIYFHGTPENAFGIYSSEKPTVGDYFILGSQGYAEAGVLNFICSAYYVKLNGFNLGGDGRDVLKNLGLGLAGKMDADTTLPKPLQAFPDAGKIANSERFILNNFLGHDFLHHAYTADYRVNELVFQLFIIHTGSEAESRTMLEKYAALEREKPVRKIQPGTLTINDPYNGPMQIFWRGKFICGSSSQTPAAAAAIAALAQNLL